MNLFRDSTELFIVPLCISNVDRKLKSLPICPESKGLSITPSYSTSNSFWFQEQKPKSLSSQNNFLISNAALFSFLFFFLVFISHFVLDFWLILPPSPPKKMLQDFPCMQSLSLSLCLFFSPSGFITGTCEASWHLCPSSRLSVLPFPPLSPFGQIQIASISRCSAIYNSSCEGISPSISFGFFSSALCQDEWIFPETAYLLL